MAGAMQMMLGNSFNIGVSITPGSGATSSSTSSYGDTTATAQIDAGTPAPSSYTWGVVSGDGAVVAGQGTATATLRTSDGDGTSGGGIGYAVYYCDVVIAGVTYRAQCDRTHNYDTGVGGGGQ